MQTIEQQQDRSILIGRIILIIGLVIAFTVLSFKGLIILMCTNMIGGYFTLYRPIQLDLKKWAEEKKEKDHEES